MSYTFKLSPECGDNSLGGDLDLQYQQSAKKQRISNQVKLEHYDDYNSSTNPSLLGSSPSDADVGLTSCLQQHQSAAVTLGNTVLNGGGGGGSMLSSTAESLLTSCVGVGNNNNNMSSGSGGSNSLQFSDRLSNGCYPSSEPTAVASQQHSNGVGHQATIGGGGGPRGCSGKPSEAMFVRLLIRRCKRLAPLWFRGVSSMREKNREENRRATANSSQSHSNWNQIAEKISEMSPSCETDAVGNLLKKLYKELPTEMVFWFIKCWLVFPEAVDDDSCVLSRGDAKGRMRRIDGGKGSDKVWRLDTIVGMLYHGLPMSSTDTNIMVHTCEQELCVRPQHLRFRASSVALVVVLKALAQAGYQIVPPPGRIPEVKFGPMDEAVDISGPFSIEELERYRSEELITCKQTVGKYVLNSSDVDLLDTNPLLKDHLTHMGEDYNHVTTAVTRTSSFHRVPPTSTTQQTPSSSSTTSSTDHQHNNHNHPQQQQQQHPHSNHHQQQHTQQQQPAAPRRSLGLKRSLTPNTIPSSTSSSSFHPANGPPRANVCLSPPILTSQAPASVARPSAFSQPQRYSPAMLGGGGGSHQLHQSSAAASPPGGGGVVGPSGSGKNTPRQPAKKRLEARTPTLEMEIELAEAGVEEELAASAAADYFMHKNSHFTPVSRLSESSVTSGDKPPGSLCGTDQGPSPVAGLSAAIAAAAAAATCSGGGLGLSPPEQAAASRLQRQPPNTVTTPSVVDCERELADILDPPPSNGGSGGAGGGATVRPTPMRVMSPSDLARLHAAQLFMQAYRTSPVLNNSDVVELVGSLMSKYGVSVPRPGSSAAQQIYYSLRNPSASPLHLRHLSFTPLSVESELNQSVEGRGSTTLRTPDFLMPSSFQLPPTNSSTPTASHYNNICK